MKNIFDAFKPQSCNPFHLDYCTDSTYSKGYGT